MTRTQRRSLREATANKLNSKLLQEEEPQKQVHAYIPQTLHTRFKIKVVSENRKMTDVLEEMIVNYVEGPAT